MKAVYLIPQANHNLIYGPDEQRDIANRVELVAPRLDPTTYADYCAAHPEAREAEAIFSGWGMARMDATFFECFPKLKILFYGAGAVEGFVTDDVWERGVSISNANVPNGVPVAEYVVAQIFLCLKQVWPTVLRMKREKTWQRAAFVHGAYQSTVGIISLGAIGRMVAERLRHSDLNVIAYDPFAKPEEARQLGVELVPLEDVFAKADVVTCHTPWLPETVGMLTGTHLRSMKPNASFINTSRGAVVRESELIDVLRERDDLTAVLDVTYPEPPTPDSPLYTLPNVILTPHIAGSMGNECRRMGRTMVDELDRWLRGEPLLYPVSRAYARARG